MSACPSPTRQYSVETAKLVIKLFSPSGSHTILVFLHQTAWQYSDEDSLDWGVECGLDQDTVDVPSLNCFRSQQSKVYTCDFFME